MFESCRAHSRAVMMRPAISLVGLLAVLTGCGGWEGGKTPGTQTVLHISAWPNGKDRGSPLNWRLHCDLSGGTHPNPEKACEQLFGLEDPFAPTPADVACARVYGGPAVAEVKGLFRGETVAARFTRSDGCQIERWERHAFLFPVRPGPAS
jgi:Subtilisin inhibitor-like